MAKLSVVIVNWNSGSLLAQCVASVFQHSTEDVLGQVVVVDNASHDTSLTLLKQQFPQKDRLHVIANPHNRGFAAANNQAIQYLLAHPTHQHDHVLLLNDDTIVPDRALATLRQVLEESPAAGIVGPQLRNRNGTLQPSVRAFPTLLVLCALILKLPRLLPSLAWWRRYLQADFNYTQQQVVDQVMGAAFLIRNELLRPGHAKYVGLLDESFFVWFEEVDYCQRAKAAGWQVLYTPQTQITHIGGVSFAQLIGFKRSLPWLSSAIHYAQKHLGKGAAFTLVVLTPVALLLTIPASFFNWLGRRHAS